MPQNAIKRLLVELGHRIDDAETEFVERGVTVGICALLPQLNHLCEERYGVPVLQLNVELAGDEPKTYLCYSVRHVDPFSRERGREWAHQVDPRFLKSEGNQRWRQEGFHHMRNAVRTWLRFVDGSETGSETRLLTLKEFAVKAGKDVQTLRNKAVKRRFPDPAIVGKGRTPNSYREDDLVRWFIANFPDDAWRFSSEKLSTPGEQG